MYRIRIDRERCIGCLTCVTACVVSHETESGDARNRVVIDSETTPAPISPRPSSAATATVRSAPTPA